MSSGDKAVRLIEESQELAVRCLIEQSRDGSPTAAKALLEMARTYQPGLKITGEISHEHEHRVLQVNVRELSAEEFRQLQEDRRPRELPEALPEPQALEAAVEPAQKA